MNNAAAHPLASPIITPADAQDIPTISALARRIWPVAYGEILSPEQLENLLAAIYSHENLSHEMASGHRFWLAQADGQPAGFVSGYQGGDVLWLRKLYVLHEFQGRGIGQALLAALYAAFPSAREVRLFVNCDNVAAQHFYTRVGFTPIEEVPVRMGDFDFIDLVFSRPLA